MKRVLNIVLALILVLNIPLIGIPKVNAASTTYEDIKPGKYDITAKALNADSDEESGAAGFINEKASLTVSENGATLTLTILDKEMAEITGMQIEGKEAAVSGGEWTYELENIKPILNARVQYEVPALNMDHDVPFRFSLEGLDDLPRVEETEEPEERPEEPDKPEVDDGDKDGENQESGDTENPESGETEDDGEDQESGETDKEEDGSNEEGSTEEDLTEDVTLSNGNYSVPSEFLHATKDEASSMGRYLGSNLFVNIDGDTTEVTIAVNDHKTVKKLLVDGKSSIQAKLDGNIRYETFIVNDVNKELQAYVEYETSFGGGIYQGDADFRIVMDLEEAENSGESDKPGAAISAEYIQLEEGLYSIDASFINAKNGKDSAMAGYLADRAYVAVEDGNTIIYFHVEDNETVTKLTANGDENLIEITNGKQTLYGFELDDLLTELAGYADYQAPMGNGSIHYGQADFNIQLNKASVNEVDSLPFEQEEKPEGKPEKEDKVPFATIDYVIKHATEDEVSAADNFFVKPGKIIEENGKKYLQVTVKSWGMIGLLKVNGKAVQVISEDKKANTALIQFEVPNNLASELPMTMQVTVPGYYDTTHEARLVMDPDSLEEGKVDDGKPGKPTPEKPGKSTPEKPEKPVKPGKDEKVIATTASNINYVIKHATLNEVSAADNFFVKPGLLLEKDGKYYLQLKVNNWSMIDWLKVNGKAIVVIQEDKQADTATIQFEVPKNLNETISLSMKVTVPGLYETTHEARLVLDESSLEVVEGTYEIYGMSDGGTPGKEDPLEKPTFDPETTAIDGDKTMNQKPGSEQLNPQTGDKSSLLLYTLLLLGSAITLVIGYRRYQLNN